MNMMPRWDDGWGYQFIEEYRHESDLLLGSRALHPGYTEDVHLLTFPIRLHLGQIYPPYGQAALCARRPAGDARWLRREAH